MILDEYEDETIGEVATYGALGYDKREIAKEVDIPYDDVVRIQSGLREDSGRLKDSRGLVVSSWVMKSVELDSEKYVGE